MVITSKQYITIEPSASTVKINFSNEPNIGIKYKKVRIIIPKAVELKSTCGLFFLSIYLRIKYPAIIPDTAGASNNNVTKKNPETKATGIPNKLVMNMNTESIPTGIVNTPINIVFPISSVEK